MTKLEKMINNNNITPETLSIASGVDQKTINDIFDGKITINNIKLYDALMICKTLADICETDRAHEDYSELKHPYIVMRDLLNSDI